MSAFSWPALVLVYHDSSIWQVERVKPYGKKSVHIREFKGSLFDVDIFGITWVYSDCGMFDYRLRWVPSHRLTVLNEMEVIALVAREDFPADRVLSE